MCTKMRFTVSLSLLVLGSVDWILYQLDTVRATLEEEDGMIEEKIIQYHLYKFVQEYL